MRIERRPPRANGVPPGAVLGGVLALGAALAAAWMRLGLPLPVCYLRAWTGWPCPTCGATRMVRAVLEGQLGRALASNPLLFLGLAGVAVWAVASVVARVFDLPTWRVTLEPREWLVARVVALLLLASDWVYLVWRGV